MDEISGRRISTTLSNLLEDASFETGQADPTEVRYLRALKTDLANMFELGELEARDSYKIFDEIDRVIKERGEALREVERLSSLGPGCLDQWGG